jgi:hypothetical protein
MALNAESTSDQIFEAVKGALKDADHPYMWLRDI